MFDTLAVAQELAAGGVAREQAEVIAKALHNGLEQGDHVTADQYLETKVIRWIVGTARTRVCCVATRVI